MLTIDSFINILYNLISNNTKLIVALGLYKSGNIDLYAKSGMYEWINNSNILSKEIELSSKVSNYDGFSLYRYDYIFAYNNRVLEEEVKRIKELIKKN